MKKLLLFLVIFLASCAPAPQVTVTLEVTVTSTPLPTETPMPTETPQPTPTSPTTYTPDQLAGMTPDQIAALAPATTDEGYARGATSTLENKMGIVKYYDKNNELVMVYDLVKGKYETPQQAGIIELQLNDGTGWEMPWFATAQEAIDFAARDGAWGTYADFQKTKNTAAFYNSHGAKLGVNKIVERTGASVYYDDPAAGKAFELTLGNFKGRTIVIYMDESYEFHSAFSEVDYKTMADQLAYRKVVAPDKNE